MEAITINGKTYTPEFNYGFFKNLRKELNTNNPIDQLLSGLADNDPETLITMVHTGLMSQANTPSKEDVANGMDELFAEMKDDELFRDAVKELQKSGFLLAMTKRWMKSSERMLKASKEVLENVSEKEQAQAEMELAQVDNIVKTVKKYLK
ncbi:tail assembly chaperone [Pediococcus pentosaceus]|uniref:tail assembly chaperone n=1 Tax=Pediococcus pentosaceus TaxID=1255 RepID=UPI00265B01B4|nr:tail assembly chaperone [Pediococcus pentosaceus]WKF70459.1 tail assembly chaperone [Pediococcus pentosaceus]